MFLQKIVAVCLICLLLNGCGEQDFSEADKLTSYGPEFASQSAGDQVSKPSPKNQLAHEPVQADPLVNNALDEFGINLLKSRRTGDLDMMEEKRVIRVLTVYGLGRYWLDGPEEKGLTYELFKMFETFINQRLDRNELKVHVVFIPVSRDELITGLIEGRGDIVAAGLTMTAQRDAVIDFTNAASKKISEVLVTGPSAPPLGGIEDLAGRKIYVRASSSYRSSLDELNVRFRQTGKEEVELLDADETLEDEDILEMVNAGLLDWAVVDDYKARIWADVFKHLVVREDIVFRDGGHIAFAIRQDSPLLKLALNDFLKTHKQGTLSGNILINRNFRDFDWAKNALDASDYQRFQDLVGIFELYGEQYGVDYLMVAAQGYQESRLDQSAKSGAGAIGIMQLLPSTAKDPNVGIPDISSAESNIHAGVKYLNFIRERYFSDPEIDRFNKTLFAFAAYNAGPARVRKLRAKAAKAGYNPNVWFDNVEVIAAKEIGRETVQYVANILKYYIAYRLSIQQQSRRDKARRSHGVG